MFVRSRSIKIFLYANLHFKPLPTHPNLTCNLITSAIRIVELHSLMQNRLTCRNQACMHAGKKMQTAKRPRSGFQAAIKQFSMLNYCTKRSSQAKLLKQYQNQRTNRDHGSNGNWPSKMALQICLKPSPICMTEQDWECVVSTWWLLFFKSDITLLLFNYFLKKETERGGGKENLMLIESGPSPKSTSKLFLF